MAAIKKVKKYQNSGKPIKKKVPETPVVGDDLSISNAVRRLVKNPKNPDNVVNQLMRLNPITQTARAVAEGITRVGGALGNKGMKKENARRDSIYNAQKKELQKDRKGGKVKKAQVGTVQSKSKNRLAEENSRAWAENERRVTGPKGPKTTSAQNTSEWAQRERKVTSRKIDKNEKLTTPLKKGGKVAKSKDDKWIQKAVNPAHKGFCTPMTKATCTPKRKALAKTFKKMAKARKK